MQGGLEKSLDKRFPESALLKNFFIFDLEEFPSTLDKVATYGDEEMELFLKRYGVPMTLSDGTPVPPFVDHDVCREEWRSLRWEIQASHAKSFGTKAWPKLFKDYKGVYPNIFKLISIYLVLPVSTAIVERGFSLLNSCIKTKARIRLLPETEAILLYLKVNLPALYLLEEGINMKKKPRLNVAAHAVIERAKELWFKRRNRQAHIR